MIRLIKQANIDSKFQPIKLLPHQRRLLEKLNDVTFPIYICWSMGSGKTIGATMCMTMLKPKSKVLIICDKSTLAQWQKEVEKVMLRNHASFADDIHVDLVHYEYLDRDERPYPKHYAMTIVDESHRFRNAWAKQSVRMIEWMQIIHACPKVIFLSGTPIVHDAQVERDAFNHMMVHPDLYGRVFFYDPRQDPKSENKYPKLTKENVTCPMSWAQCFVYLQNRKQQFSLQLRDESSPRVRMSSSKNTYNTLLRSLSNNPFPDNPALSPKFQVILGKMESLCHENKKQIVYSCRKDTGVKSLQLLWDQLGTEKGSFQITGDMSQEDRATNIQKFNRKPKSVLFITDAGAQGIDLKRVDVVHIMEPAENIQDERQIINRAVRYKSHSAPDSSVHVYRYVCTFPTSGSVAPPWKRVIYESGLFAKEELTGITRKIQYALKDIIKNEESGITIDERVMQTREEREHQIIKEINLLKTFSA